MGPPSTSSPSPTGSGTPSDSCGSPPPAPTPWLDLSYPISGSVNVSPSIGELIFFGLTNGYYGPAKVMLSSQNGQVPVGSFTAPPSPLPSPHATPTGGNNLPYVAAPIPSLSPQTTYNVSYSYTDWANDPPSCTTEVTKPAGSFSTQ